MFGSPDLPVFRVGCLFEWRGLRLLTWKLVLKLWGLPWKRVWYVRGLPWNLVGDFGRRNHYKSDLVRPCWHQIELISRRLNWHHGKFKKIYRPQWYPLSLTCWNILFSWSVLSLSDITQTQLTSRRPERYRGKFKKFCRPKWYPLGLTCWNTSVFLVCFVSRWYHADLSEITQT